MSALQRLFSPKSSTTKLPSSAEIEIELNQERLALNQAVPVLQTLIEKRRRMLLVNSSPKDLDQIEAEIANSTRTRDRAAARVEALTSAFADANEREKEAEIRATYDAATAKIEAAFQWQQNQYEPLARELAEGFRLLKEADELANNGSILIPDGAEPLQSPSTRRLNVSISQSCRLYTGVEVLQSLDGSEPHFWASVGNKFL